jgi:pimeloyl-ACP methyl ester carboxylesterase
MPMALQIPKPVQEPLGRLSRTLYRCALINGARLPYVDEGRGAPVVLVHGAFADHRNWEPQRAAIARGYRFIAYSQRYFGPEPWLDAGELYSQETHVADLASFIRSLDAGPVYVIARSYGATVSLVAGLRHPELMRALLVQEPQIKSLVTDPAERQLLRTEGLGLGAVRAAADAADADHATRLFFDWVNGQPGSFELIPDEARRYHLANGRTIALHFAAPPGPRLSRADLSALRVPLTVTLGEFTRPYMRICAEAVHRSVPGSSLVVIPKARHAASAQNPRGFNDVILGFLATQ